MQLWSTNILRILAVTALLASAMVALPPIRNSWEMEGEICDNKHYKEGVDEESNTKWLGEGCVILPIYKNEKLSEDKHYSAARER